MPWTRSFEPFTGGWPGSVEPRRVVPHRGTHRLILPEQLHAGAHAAQARVRLQGRDARLQTPGQRLVLPDSTPLCAGCGTPLFEAANLPLQSYALLMAAAATLVMWFQLRSPELAEEFERMMASDRDIVHSSLETMPDWRLMRPTDVPGQASESADYVLIAEIVNIAHWQQQAELRVQALADDLEHLVSSRRMLVLERIL